MGFKLALPSLPFSKSAPSSMAQTHARLKAWWNGEEPAKPAIVSDEGGATSDSQPPIAEVNWSTMHAVASAAIWGSGRTYPSTLAFETMLLAEANVPRSSRTAIFAGSAGALARAAVDCSAGKIEMFESDPVFLKLSEDLCRKSKQAKRIGHHSYDWTPGKLPKGKADSVIFSFQGGLEGRIEAASFSAERILRPKGYCLWVDMFAREDSQALDECRGYEMRKFGTEDEAIIAFSASGLNVVGDDDWSARFLEAYDVAWRDLSINLGLRQANLIKTGGIHAGTAAIANLLCWKARHEAIRAGKITVRRYLLQA